MHIQNKCLVRIYMLLLQQTQGQHQKLLVVPPVAGEFPTFP